MTSPDSSLADRYGARRGGGRLALIAASTLLALVFLTWLAWSAWVHATPDARSELIGFDVVDQHTTTAIVSVSLEDGADASCRLKAFSEDHNTVGELSFTPVDGRNDVVIRTERKATSVESVGCTTPDQQRPR